MVAKGKGRVGSKPSSAVVAQVGSREGTTPNTAPALIRSIEEIGELSDEDQVSSEQLQALHKRVAKQEEYTTLLR